MHIIRVGRRWLNLEAMVMAEQLEPSHDVLRVTMRVGKEFDLTGREAEYCATKLDEAEYRGSERPAVIGQVVPSVDPETGEPLPAKSVAST